jgi:hypothetical protein|tara:strand:- start:936 stop:1310 length:375 start_codon:yes stop_codon:yes gene_type:complete
MDRWCLSCNNKVEGRVDKLFCSPYCKSSYHYIKNRNKKMTRFNLIDVQLKRNRSILKHFHKTGKTTILKSELIDKGFNPNYFTNYWKNNNNEVYLFCYEYGFLSLDSFGKNKYLIIDWQDYMEK